MVSAQEMPPGTDIVSFVAILQNAENEYRKCSELGAAQ